MLIQFYCIFSTMLIHQSWAEHISAGLILSLHPSNETRRYFQPCKRQWSMSSWFFAMALRSMVSICLRNQSGFIVNWTTGNWKQISMIFCNAKIVIRLNWFEYDVWKSVVILSLPLCAQLDGKIDTRFRNSISAKQSLFMETTSHSMPYEIENHDVFYHLKV